MENSKGPVVSFFNRTREKKAWRSHLYSERHVKDILNNVLKGKKQGEGLGFGEVTRKGLTEQF